MNLYFSKIKLISKKINYWYLVSFASPLIAFILYFIVRNHGAILTVDLGQQYIDLLAFYRTSLLHNPLNLIYSFSNGLGNSMIGTFAYYLASPLNLLLLLFPINMLPQAILILISIKVGLIGLTSYYYFSFHFKLNPVLLLSASFAYALSGFVISNNLNLMWLDSVYLLPLLIMSLDKLLNNQKDHLILITFAIWITNFYTGYMTLLFGAIYFGVNYFLIKQKDWHLIINYLVKSIIGSLLSCWLLIPTILELLQGKATDATVFNWRFSFPLQNLLAKFITGSFSFHEMSSGMPNIFYSTPLFLLSLIYFFNKKINWKSQLSYAFFAIFLIISLSYNPLILLWHLGQFPVWYPGRFSFCFSFLGIYLALQTLKQVKYSKIQLTLLTMIFIGISVFIIVQKNKFTFLDSEKIAFTIIMGIITLLLLYFYKSSNETLINILGALIIISSANNLVESLQNISYQQNKDYSNSAINILAATSELKKVDPGFYRIEKSFSRSDDDSLSGNYYGTSNFNSISNKRVNNIVKYLGMDHNSNSFANNFSTPVVDSLLGIKYYLLPNLNRDNIPLNSQMFYDNQINRLDLKQDKIISNQPQLEIAENPNFLPIVFISKPNKKIKWFNDAPIINQTNLFQAITNTTQPIFDNIGWSTPHLSNAKATANMTYQKIKSNKVAKITFWIFPDTNDNYYLELPASLDTDQASLFVNNQPVSIEDRDSENRLINLCAHSKDTPIKLIFELKNNDLDLNQASLWRLNSNFGTTINKFNRIQPHTKQRNSLMLQTNKFVAQNKVIKTTIPYSNNWLVFDNGRLQQSSLFADTFLQSTLNKTRQHRLTFIYIPWAFLIGIFISVTTLIAISVANKKRE